MVRPLAAARAPVRSNAGRSAGSLRRAGKRLSEGTHHIGALLWKPVPGIFFWAPVWIPLLLWTQFALLGLRPALAEGRRLAGEEARLAPAHAEALAENEDIAATLIAWQDPVYRERWYRHVRTTMR